MPLLWKLRTKSLSFSSVAAVAANSINSCIPGFLSWLIQCWWFGWSWQWSSLVWSFILMFGWVVRDGLQLICWWNFQQVSGKSLKGVKDESASVCPFEFAQAKIALKFLQNFCLQNMKVCLSSAHLRLPNHQNAKHGSVSCPFLHAQNTAKLIEGFHCIDSIALPWNFQFQVRSWISSLHQVAPLDHNLESHWQWHFSMLRWWWRRCESWCCHCWEAWFSGLVCISIKLIRWNGKFKLCVHNLSNDTHQQMVLMNQVIDSCCSDSFQWWSGTKADESLNVVC